MHLIWNLPAHTFAVGGRLYKLGSDAVHVPDPDAAQIFGTRKWQDASAKGKATSIADAKFEAQKPQPLESKEERRAKKAAAAKAEQEAAPPQESDAE